MSEAKMIRPNNVVKVFRDRRGGNARASGIQLEVRAGEFLAISGPSGCGKSTLLAILGLLDSPSEGEYALPARRLPGSVTNSVRVSAIAKSVSSSRPST